MSDGRRRSNASLAVSLAAIAAGMAMLAFASVPLYRLFCQATGFGGTPIRGERYTGPASERGITVEFNAIVAPGLPWEFVAETPRFPMKAGVNQLTHYRAKNLENTPTTGHATYNVLPEKAAPYFMKIDCFCFKDQTLEAGQEAMMPVAFYIDPAIADDPLMQDVKTITLSYTFFPSKSNTINP